MRSVLGQPIPVASLVIKHRAPNGALRLHWFIGSQHLFHDVIKHRAPNGALRRADLGILPPAFTERVMKHRATGGALRPDHTSGCPESRSIWS